MRVACIPFYIWMKLMTTVVVKVLGFIYGAANVTTTTTRHLHHQHHNLASARISLPAQPF